MMLLHVHLFARCRDLAGADRVAVEVPEGATVGAVRRRLGELYPALTGLLERSVMAVDNEFAGEDKRLTAADEIALLPPVSGG